MTTPERDLAVIDELLTHHAASFVYPPTPNLAPRLRVEPAAPRPPVVRPPFALLGATLAAVVLGLTVLLTVSGGAREALADLFGRNVPGLQVDPTLTATPAPSATPTGTTVPSATPIELDERLDPISLDEAAEVLGSPLRLPPDEQLLGAFHHDSGVRIRNVVFHYRRFDFWQFPSGGLGKGVAADQVIVELEVDGQPAYWLEGGRHIVEFRDSAGNPVAGTQRVVDRNTLVWAVGPRLYRIETTLALEETLAIVDTLDPPPPTPVPATPTPAGDGDAG